MKYLKLFETFDFGYEIPMTNSPIKDKWDKIEYTIKDRLIDLDDSGYTIAVNPVLFFSSNMISIEITIPSPKEELFNILKPYDVIDIKEDLLALISDIESNEFYLKEYRIQSSSDFRSYTFDNKISNFDDVISTKVNSIELVFVIK